MMRHRYWLLLPALLLMMPPAVGAAVSPDEAAARQVVDRLFAAYVKKDLNGFMACWSETSPDYAARKQTMARIFAETGPLDLKDLAVVKARAGQDTARMRVRAEVTGQDAKTGRPHPDLGRMNRVIHFIKSDKGWLIAQYGSAEQDLADRLAAATSKKERAGLLAEDQDLVGREFIGVLVDRGQAFVNKGNPAPARPWFELTLEVAATLPDKSLLAGLHGAHAIYLSSQRNFAEAARHCEQALALRRELKDRRGEAVSLYELANCLRELEWFADALARYDESLVVSRQLGDRQLEAFALNNSGIALDRLGRFDEALRRVEAGLALLVQSGDQTEELAARRNIAKILYRAGRYGDALRHHEAALAIARELRDAKTEENVVYDIGNVYLSTGRYPEALAKFERCLAMARARRDPVGEGYVLSNIGLVYGITGRLADEIDRQEACLKIARANGARRLETKALGNLGNAYAAVGRLAEALRQHEAALRIDEDLGDRDVVIGTRMNIANLYLKTGKYDAAIELYEANLDAARETGLRATEALARHNLGVAWSTIGRYADAAAQGDAALRLYRDLGDRAGEAHAQSAFGDILTRTGQYPEALRHFEAALATSRAIGDRKCESSCLSSIGMALLDTGRYGEALARIESALAICREIGDRAGEAHTLNKLGLALYKAARPDEAARHFEVSLKLARDLGDPGNEAIFLRNLGYCDFMRKKYADALHRYETARAIERRLKTRHEEAHTVHAMGAAYFQLDRYGDALEAYEAGLAIYREFGDRRSEAMTLMKMGILSVAQKRYEEAGERLRSALAIAEPLGDSQIALSAYNTLGYLHSERKQWVEAAAAYRRSIAHVEALRAELRETSLRVGFLDRNINSYINLARCLLDGAGPAAPGEAFLVAEQAKARTLVEILQAGKADVGKGMTQAELSEDNRLRAAVTMLGVQLEQASGNRVEAVRQEEMARRLADARGEFDQFRRRVYLAHPELQIRQARFDPTSLVDLNRTLFARQPGLCVLSYLVADEEVLIFALRRGSDPAGAARLNVTRVPVGTADMAEAVGTFRRACQRPGGGAPDGEPLYGWLLAPVADYLEGTEHVVVIPDGVLHTLPFQALKDGAGKYLVERASVSYAPSVTALEKMVALAEKRRHERSGPGSVLAVGRPAFGGGLKDLPASEPEARAVAGLFPGRATLLLGPAADKAAVLAALGSARYVHLATHGLLNEANPLYSAVALTPAPGRDDGRLYARELLDLDLRAELVVLSACETALGKQVSGEGILGLAWALFVAGAPSSVVTQWSVADDSTGALMADFHKRVAGGAGKAAALRQAQLALIKDRRTRHPFFWAPFILVGDEGG